MRNLRQGPGTLRSMHDKKDQYYYAAIFMYHNLESTCALLIGENTIVDT